MKKPKYTPCPVCGRPYIGLKAHIQDTYDDAHNNYRKEHGIKAGNNCKPKSTTRHKTTSKNEITIATEPKKTEQKYFTPEHPELGRKAYSLRFQRKKKNQQKSNKSNNKSTEIKPQSTGKSQVTYGVTSALDSLVLEKQGKLNLTSDQRDACLTVLENARKDFGLPEGTSYATIYEAYRAHLEESLRKSKELLKKLNETTRTINRSRELKRLDGRRRNMESFEEIKNKYPEINAWLSKIPMQPEVSHVVEKPWEKEEIERIARVRQLLNKGGA